MKTWLKDKYKRTPKEKMSDREIIKGCTKEYLEKGGKIREVPYLKSGIHRKVNNYIIEY